MRKTLEEELAEIGMPNPQIQAQVIRSGGLDGPPPQVPLSTSPSIQIANSEPEAPPYVSQPLAEPPANSENQENDESPPLQEPAVEIQHDEESEAEDFEQPIPLKEEKEDDALTASRMKAMLKDLVQEKEKPTEDLSEEGVGVLDSEDVKALLDKISDSPKLTALLETRVNELLAKERAATNQKLVNSHLDKNYPAAKRYLGSKQYADFLNSDVGGGTMETGTSFGDVLHKAYLEGNISSASAVMEQFLGSVRGSKVKRIEPSQGGIATSMRRERPKAPPPPINLNQELDNLERAARSGILSKEEAERQLKHLLQSA